MFFFDRERGLVEEIRRKRTQSHGFVGKRTELTKLESVETKDADWRNQFLAGANLYFDAHRGYQELLQRARRDHQNSKKLLGAASSILESTRDKAHVAIIRQHLDRQIQQHDTRADPIVREAEYRAKVIGRPAADWETTDFEGKTHSLRQYRGRVVILDFWYRGCGWCMRAMPQVKEVAASFKGRDVTVLGMTTDRKDEDAEIVIETMQLDYPNLRAEGIPEKYGVPTFPTLIIIDQKGIIYDVHVGYSSTLAKEVKETVEALLSRSPAPASNGESPDAEQLLKRELARAESEKKSVLVYLTAEWCGWCHVLEEFLRQHEMVLRKDYVLVEIDLGTKHAEDVSKRLRKGRGGGVPWMGILDPKGNVLVTSDGPKGNIGYPGDPDGISHFAGMLKNTAKRLGPEQIARIEQALKNAAKAAAEKSIALAVHVVDDETGDPVEKFGVQHGSEHPTDPNRYSWYSTRVDGGGHPQGKFTFRCKRGLGETGEQKDQPRPAIRILADGYLPQPFWDFPFAQPEKVSVIRLKRGQEVRGRVVDHTGKAVAGAAVFLCGPRPVRLLNGKAEAFPGSTAKTDADGRFVLTGAGREATHVVVSAERFCIWAVKIADLGRQLAIRLPEPATVVLRYDIPDADAEGRFTLWTWNNPNLLGAISHSEQQMNVVKGGEIVLENVTPGDYKVRREPKLQPGRPFALYERRYFTLESGKTTVLDFVRDRGQPISGIVLGLKETGAATAAVQMFPEDGQDPVEMAYCEADGKFQTATILPGTYKLSVWVYKPRETRGGGPRLRGPDLAGTARATVTENGPPPDVEIELGPWKPGGESDN